MTFQWYALRTKPHKEQVVYRQLLNQEINVYYPCLRVKPKNPRASKVRAYFPGYMFVNLDLEQAGINVLSWMPGTRGLVIFGDEPAVVPDILIHKLQQDVATANEREWQATHQFRKGDRVRITDGPLAGYEALFDRRLSGKDRVQLLIAFLSHHPQPIQLPLDQIRKIQAPQENTFHVT